MTRQLIEKQMVARIVRHLPRRPAPGGPADVELVDFDPRSDSLLAVAADSLSEEMATGLYDDPYTVGWVTVMSPASDLAAAGARLLGVSVLLNLPGRFGRRDCMRLARGIGDACRSLGTVTLGGDTNASGELVTAACAVGLVARDRVVTRAGARPGDAVFLSGPAGLGNAYALARFDPAAPGPDPASRGRGPARASGRFPFRPRAPLEFGQLAGRYASASMDTSDGVMATLDELSRTNAAGFAITADPGAVLHPRAARQCRRRGMPAWLALAGCHGEFELVVTVPAKRVGRFVAAARRAGFNPLRLGQVVQRPGVVLAWAGRPVRIDSGWLRNQATRAARDVPAYIRALVEFAQRVGQ